MKRNIDQIKSEAKNFKKGILHPNRVKQFKSQIGQNVINLTDKTFSDEEMKLLNLGLTFSPTPNTHGISDLWLDYKKFQRSLQLKHHFRGQETKVLTAKEKLFSKFRNKSEWKPTDMPLSIINLTKGR